MSPKRTGIITPSVLLAAIKRVLVEKESKKSVSIDFNIPRTSLLRYVGNVQRAFPDITVATDEEIMQVLDTSTTMGPSSVCSYFFAIFLRYFCIYFIRRIFQIFSKIQDKALMEYIFKCSSLYHGLSITEVKQLF